MMQRSTTITYKIEEIGKMDFFLYIFTFSMAENSHIM